MNNDFDTVQYIKLLEKEKTLITNGYSLYYQNEEENSRLRSYRIILEDQIYYNNRYEYQSLIKNYLLEKISTLAFISEIFEYSLFCTRSTFVERVQNKEVVFIDIFLFESFLNNFFINSIDIGITIGKFFYKFRKMFNAISVFFIYDQFFQFISL
jgi:hypothetical protein